MSDRRSELETGDLPEFRAVYTLNAGRGQGCEFHMDQMWEIRKRKLAPHLKLKPHLREFTGGARDLSTGNHRY